MTSHGAGSGRSAAASTNAAPSGASAFVPGPAHRIQACGFTRPLTARTATATKGEQALKASYNSLAPPQTNNNHFHPHVSAIPAASTGSHGVASGTGTAGFSGLAHASPLVAAGAFGPPKPATQRHSTEPGGSISAAAHNSNSASHSSSQSLSAMYPYSSSSTNAAATSSFAQTARAVSEAHHTVLAAAGVNLRGNAGAPVSSAPVPSNSSSDVGTVFVSSQSLTHYPSGGAYNAPASPNKVSVHAASAKLASYTPGALARPHTANASGPETAALLSELALASPFAALPAHPLSATFASATNNSNCNIAGFGDTAPQQQQRNLSQSQSLSRPRTTTSAAGTRYFNHNNSKMPTANADKTSSTALSRPQTTGLGSSRLAGTTTAASEAKTANKPGGATVGESALRLGLGVPSFSCSGPAGLLIDAAESAGLSTGMLLSSYLRGADGSQAANDPEREGHHLDPVDVSTPLEGASTIREPDVAATTPSNGANGSAAAAAAAHSHLFPLSAAAVAASVTAPYRPLSHANHHKRFFTHTYNNTNNTNVFNPSDSGINDATAPSQSAAAGLVLSAHGHAVRAPRYPSAAAANAAAAAASSAAATASLLLTPAPAAVARAPAGLSVSGAGRSGGAGLGGQQSLASELSLSIAMLHALLGKSDPSLTAAASTPALTAPLASSLSGFVSPLLALEAQLSEILDSDVRSREISARVQSFAHATGQGSETVLANLVTKFSQYYNKHFSTHNSTNTSKPGPITHGATAEQKQQSDQEGKSSSDRDNSTVLTVHSDPANATKPVPPPIPPPAPSTFHTMALACLAAPAVAALRAHLPPAHSRRLLGLWRRVLRGVFCVGSDRALRWALAESAATAAAVAAAGRATVGSGKGGYGGGGGGGAATNAAAAVATEAVATAVAEAGHVLLESVGRLSDHSSSKGRVDAHNEDGDNADGDGDGKDNNDDDQSDVEDFKAEVCVVPRATIVHSLLAKLFPQSLSNNHSADSDDESFGGSSCDNTSALSLHTARSLSVPARARLAAALPAAALTQAAIFRSWLALTRLARRRRRAVATLHPRPALRRSVQSAFALWRRETQRARTLRGLTSELAGLARGVAAEAAELAAKEHENDMLSQQLLGLQREVAATQRRLLEAADQKDVFTDEAVAAVLATTTATVLLALEVPVAVDVHALAPAFATHVDPAAVTDRILAELPLLSASAHANIGNNTAGPASSTNGAAGSQSVSMSVRDRLLVKLAQRHSDEEQTELSCAATVLRMPLPRLLGSWLATIADAVARSSTSSSTATFSMASQQQQQQAKMSKSNAGPSSGPSPAITGGVCFDAPVGHVSAWASARAPPSHSATRAGAAATTTGASAAHAAAVAAAAARGAVAVTQVSLTGSSNSSASAASATSASVGGTGEAAAAAAWAGLSPLELAGAVSDGWLYLCILRLLCPPSLTTNSGSTGAGNMAGLSSSYGGAAASASGNAVDRDRARIAAVLSAMNSLGVPLPWASVDAFIADAVAIDRVSPVGRGRGSGGLSGSGLSGRGGKGTRGGGVSGSLFYPSTISPYTSSTGAGGSSQYSSTSAGIGGGAHSYGGYHTFDKTAAYLSGGKPKRNHNGGGGDNYDDETDNDEGAMNSEDEDEYQDNDDDDANDQDAFLRSVTDPKGALTPSSGGAASAHGFKGGMKTHSLALSLEVSANARGGSKGSASAKSAKGKSKGAANASANASTSFGGDNSATAIASTYLNNLHNNGSMNSPTAGNSSASWLSPSEGKAAAAHSAMLRHFSVLCSLFSLFPSMPNHLSQSQLQSGSGSASGSRRGSIAGAAAGSSFTGSAGGSLGVGVPTVSYCLSTAAHGHPAHGHSRTNSDVDTGAGPSPSPTGASAGGNAPACPLTVTVCAPHSTSIMVTTSSQNTVSPGRNNSVQTACLNALVTLWQLEKEFASWVTHDGRLNGALPTALYNDNTEQAQSPLATATTALESYTSALAGPLGPLTSSFLPSLLADLDDNKHSDGSKGFVAEKALSINNMNATSGAANSANNPATPVTAVASFPVWLRGRKAALARALPALALNNTSANTTANNAAATAASAAVVASAVAAASCTVAPPTGLILAFPDNSNANNSNTSSSSGAKSASSGSQSPSAAHGQSSLPSGAVPLPVPNTPYNLSAPSQSPAAHTVPPQWLSRLWACLVAIDVTVHRARRRYSAQCALLDRVQAAHRTILTQLALSASLNSGNASGLGGGNGANAAAGAALGMPLSTAAEKFAFELPPMTSTAHGHFSSTGTGASAAAASVSGALAGGVSRARCLSQVPARSLAAWPPLRTLPLSRVLDLVQSSPKPAVDLARYDLTSLFRCDLRSIMCLLCIISFETYSLLFSLLSFGCFHFACVL